MWDILIALGLLLTSIGFAWLGLHPETDPKKKRVRKAGLIFLGLSAIACLLTIAQGIRSGTFQDAHRAISNINQVNIFNSFKGWNQSPRSTGAAKSPSNPSVPTQNSAPQPISPPVGNPTPYAAVLSALGAAEHLDRDWKAGVTAAFSLPAPGYYGASGVPSVESKRTVGNRLKRLDDDMAARWADEGPTIRAAHAKAIDFLGSSGVAHFTSSQIQDDLGKFNGAISAADARISYDDLVANKVDRDKFQPLVKYLGSLQIKLINAQNR
jgi:hypothetical protein